MVKLAVVVEELVYPDFMAIAVSTVLVEEEAIVKGAAYSIEEDVGMLPSKV